MENKIIRIQALLFSLGYSNTMCLNCPPDEFVREDVVKKLITGLRELGLELSTVEEKTKAYAEPGCRPDRHPFRHFRLDEEKRDFGTCIGADSFIEIVAELLP